MELGNKSLYSFKSFCSACGSTFCGDSVGGEFGVTALSVSLVASKGFSSPPREVGDPLNHDQECALLFLYKTRCLLYGTKCRG